MHGLYLSQCASEVGIIWNCPARQLLHSADFCKPEFPMGGTLAIPPLLLIDKKTQVTVGLEVGFYNMINMNKTKFICGHCCKKKNKEVSNNYSKGCNSSSGCLFAAHHLTPLAQLQGKLVFLLQHLSVRQQTWFLSQNEKARLFYF